MKKLFFVLFVCSLISCSSSKTMKAREKIYKQSTADIQRWAKEYAAGKITAKDFNTLILGQQDYLKFFVEHKGKRK